MAHQTKGAYRQPSSVLKGLRPSSKSKVDLWQELKLVSWARTVSATWLVGLLDLLLRVQLNILGRHLFMQQQWYPANRVSLGGTMILSWKAQAVQEWISSFLNLLL